jgi:hypothetical protein
MRGVRLYGWQRTGIVLSVLWVLCVSMWFFQRVADVNAPGVASVYLQCIGEPKAKRRECRARAEWFGAEARSEFRAVWPWAALGPILVVWPLAYVVVWLVRWIGRGLQSTA